MKNLQPTANTTLTPADTPALQGSLFNDFINYIDRSPATTRTYITNLRQFVAYLSFAGIHAPTRQDIINYREYLIAEHDAIALDPDTLTGWTYRTDKAGNHITISCKPDTVKQYLQSVKQFFAWTAAAGYYPNIAANVHPPKVRQDIHKKDALTAADVLTIENSIEKNARARQQATAQARKDAAGRSQRAQEQGKRIKAIYLLSVNAGLRTIEISRANIKDIGERNGQAFIYIHGKGHAEADDKKPLAMPVYKAVKEYIDSRTDNPTANSPLFVATGNRSGGKRLAPTTISTMLKKTMQAAGYNSERITAHSLRHTAGTITQELTNNIYITQKYMRHKSPKTTEIYLHNDTEKQEADIAESLYKKYHEAVNS